MLKENSKGVSLLETFIAAIVFIIAAAAIFTTMSSLRKPAVNNEQEVQAALVLSNVLDDLRAKVDARDMNVGVYNNVLSPGSNHWINGIGPGGIYNVVYVTNTTATGALQVTANILWPDAM